jgi:hypothetical protein
MLETEAPKKDKPTEKEEKAPISEKIAEIVVKVIMTGGVAGGGLGAFWSLFKDSDIPKAIASGVIGLGISYGAKLLSPVHQGTGRRLEQAGKAIDESIDDRLAQLLATVTRAEDAYLLCQALDCRDYKSEGMGRRDRIFTPMLDDVFVPLELDSSAIPAGFNPNSMGVKALYQTRCIWDFLAKAQRNPVYRQLAIVAWGGFGKTTLLKHLAYMFGSGQYQQFDVPQLIPVLLPLRQYRKQITQEQPPSLPELVMQHHVKQLAEMDDRGKLSKLPADWFKALLGKGKPW